MQRRPDLLFQHMRSDFSYEQFDDGGQQQNYFMIQPEFEASDGGVLGEAEKVPSSGTAGMWIVVDEMRAFHRDRIKIGVKGFMMEAAYRLAEVEVIEVIGLAKS